MWREDETARAMRLWEETRRPAFRALWEINAVRATNGVDPLTASQYLQARDMYYAAYPTARPQMSCGICGKMHEGAI